MCDGRFGSGPQAPGLSGQKVPAWRYQSDMSPGLAWFASEVKAMNPSYPVATYRLWPSAQSSSGKGKRRYLHHRAD